MKGRRGSERWKRAELTLRVEYPLAVVGDESIRRSSTVFVLQDQRDLLLELGMDRDAVR